MSGGRGLSEDRTGRTAAIVERSQGRYVVGWTTAGSAQMGGCVSRKMGECVDRAAGQTGDEPVGDGVQGAIVPG